MENFLICILKNGALAFLGCRITRALSQKEISEIIAASGWVMIGISAMEPIKAGMNCVKAVANGLSEVASSFKAIKDAITF